MQTTFSSGLVWLRRDLRVTDHAALYHALKHCQKVHVVFVFDTAILDKLPRADRRVEFIRDSLVQVDERLRALAGHPQAGLIVRHGVAQDKIAKLAHHLQVQAVFANHDDEPQALARDIQVRGHLADHGIVLHTFKDHVIFERNEVLTQVGKPFAVFTPYKNAWLKKITPFDLKAYPVEKYAQHLAPRPDDLAQPVPALQDIDFENTNLHALKIPPGESGGQTLLQDFLTRIDHYEDTRNFPAVKGPSYLSVHLRFGTVSIRQLAREAHARLLAGSPGAAVWLSELIWRDFYVQVLHNFSHVGRGQSFKPEYDSIKWEHGTHAHKLFDAWCQARTGYPLVDAAMRQLNQTGYMHNRLRMVVASFLVKDLGIDWRWGERYFAEHLNDFDLSANNGGWQWASSSGCDAQPYFRIFNPISQSEKFDPEGKFIRRYVPELAALPTAALHAPWLAKPMELQTAEVVIGKTYPAPIVEHADAREKTLARYVVVKKKAA
ncbi:cryptochrome/photolyase family protein [Limnohabitans planktonicus]|uniref:Deoxyribodipyrimidine photo-lyase n=1 Tax=Limnohabitans planktonicus II-D5 TaxID=1293045 RepID=A0A2T7UCL3_9BURK|nr:deoxyribodipyrimidine photo-lyase [Limnohabitans planktonicus]PVE42361.1 deoxyribodipyrimidine photo-lyase [Limnohabitans planktonicus II-D5]|eukprot:gene1849-1816_t